MPLQLSGYLPSDNGLARLEQVLHADPHADVVAVVVIRQAWLRTPRGDVEADPILSLKIGELEPVLTGDRDIALQLLDAARIERTGAERLAEADRMPGELRPDDVPTDEAIAAAEAEPKRRGRRARGTGRLGLA
jgi:hypothetical protein